MFTHWTHVFTSMEPIHHWPPYEEGLNHDIRLLEVITSRFHYFHFIRSGENFNLLYDDNILHETEPSIVCEKQPTLNKFNIFSHNDTDDVTARCTFDLK